MIPEPEENTRLLRLMRRIGYSFSGMNVYLFFLLIFIYHVLVTFQGIDFNDEGFHVAFYQQIFHDPESVQYAFWGWLSGIVGGGFMKTFPFLGIWGIRLLGAIVSTGTIAIAFNLLKRYLHNGWLKLSLILLSLFINEDAKNLYYNNLSAFLYFVSAYFLFVGIRDKKKLFLFAGGFFIGLNVFSRLPNLLGVGMILSIFYYGYLTRERVKDLLIRSCFFLSGILVAFLLVYLAMKSLHHLGYFIESVKMISASSQGASLNDGLDGAYGIGNMLKTNLSDYLRSLEFVLMLCLPVLLAGYVNYSYRNSSKLVDTGVLCFNFIITLGVFLMAITGGFTSFRLLELFTGFSLLSVLVLIDNKTAADFKLLTFIGCLILLIHPFGSASGIATVVVYSMWICFPVTLDYMAGLKWLNLELKVDSSAGVTSLKSFFNAITFRRLRWILVIVISVACLYNVINYPYLCDRHSRLEMRYSVDNKFMKGVFTSKGRADALDDLLKASARYVKPDDVVLAYDCMPMYHFMTQTKSYVRNPCIWFYTTYLFREEMKWAEAHQSGLPVIVRQLVKTTGDGSGWPEVRPAEDYLHFKRTQGKNQILDDFIKRHQYREVWNNGIFTILVPQKR